MRLVLFAAMTLAGAGLSAQSLVSRVAAAEGIVAAHYRGEPLDVARARSNAAIDAYNARTKAAQAELDAAKAAWERSQAPSREAEAALRARIQALDEALKVIPDGNDQPGNARYQAKVQERKALVKQVNELIAQSNAALEATNAKVRAVQAELGAQREQVQAELQAVNRRVDAFAAFAKGGGDLAFFTTLNGLLAEARKGGDAAALAKVRALRRELGTWAAAAEARSPHGLVVVEARLGDEPLWLVLDTGASDVVLPPELLEAVGVPYSGEQTTFTVVGGQRLSGRAATLPALTVAGQTQPGVAATAVRPFQVGVDGLLGQSFLKGFVYTVDERKEPKLNLTPR